MKKLKVGDIINITKGMEIKTKLPSKFFNKNNVFSDEYTLNKITVGQTYVQTPFTKSELIYEIEKRLSNIVYLNYLEIEKLIDSHPTALVPQVLDTSYLAGEYIVTSVKRILVGHLYIEASKVNDENLKISLIINPD